MIPHLTFYHHVNQFADYRSILCLNGDLPPKEFFNELPIIAADGALNALMKMGITPQLVIGDLDQADPKLLEQVPSLYILDQNKNDFQKAMDYLEEQQLLPTIIYGVNGGYLDHILNNINLFMSYNLENIFFAPPIVGHLLQEGVQRFSLPINTKISLIALPQANILTQGLKWNLNNAKLTFPGDNSCFNRTANEEITIEVTEGKLLVLIYLEAIEDAATLKS